MPQRTPQSLAEALRLLVGEVEDARAGKSSIHAERMTNALDRCRELAAVAEQGTLDPLPSAPLSLRERGLLSSLIGGARLVPTDAPLARSLELRGLVVLGHDGVMDLGYTTTRGAALLDARSAA